MNCFSSLSNEILAQIFRNLFELVSELAYVLELRLTCRTFDKHIAHELFNGGDYQFVPPDPDPIQHPAFPRRKGTMSLVRSWSRHAPKVLCWLNRQYLLARMLSPKSKDPRRLALFLQFHVAAQSLHDILEKNHLIKNDLCAMLSPSVRSKTSELNVKVAYALVCEAALSLFDDDAIMNHSTLLPLQIEFHGESITWIVNVACWAGSRALFDALETQTLPLMPSIESSITGAALRCLPTVIWRGHHDFASYILSLAPLVLPERDRFSLCPIQTAIHVGDLEVVQQILHIVGPLSISQRLFTALSTGRPRPDRLEEYNNILQVLLPELKRVRNVEPMALARLTRHITSIGEPSVLGQLSDHGLMSAYDVQVTWGQVNAFRAPCQSGNVAMIRGLFHADYLCDVNNHTSADTAVFQAAITALEWNHLEVFEELKRNATVMFDDERWLPHFFIATAGAHSDDLSEIFSPLSADLMHKPVVKTSVKGTQGTVGQAALERAIQFLRPANVKSLLDAGVRFEDARKEVRVSWSYVKSHKESFDLVQQLLANCGMPSIFLNV